VKQEALMPERKDGDRRLHIGGKDVKAGWEIFDAIAAGHVDHVGNARDLSRFADGTFAQLYASHVLEHFDYKDAIAAVLREWHRVLKPGGILCVSVPDMERLCHLYLTPGLAPEMRFQLMRMVFGGHLDDYDYHLTGLDELYLRRQLQQAGFSAIQRVESFGLFQDTSVMQVLGVPISLNVAATR
jgi:predicted SAM-dependent methyltransferase